VKKKKVVLKENFFLERSENKGKRKGGGVCQLETK
jgi:hypothetical protein